MTIIRSRLQLLAYPSIQQRETRSPKNIGLVIDRLSRDLIMFFLKYIFLARQRLRERRGPNLLPPSPFLVV